MDTIKHGTTGLDLDIASMDIAAPQRQIEDWRERLQGVIPEDEKRGIAWHVGNQWPAVAAVKYFPNEVRCMLPR